MASLSVCNGCGRHVRRTEVACPFCGATGIDSEDRSHEVPALPNRLHLTRAAFVFASATAVASCGPSQPPPGTLQPYAPPPIDLTQNDAGPPPPPADSGTKK